MYVHVCDITTCTSNRYEHERHTDHSIKDIKFNIVHCSMLRTMVDARGCSLCSPSNVQREVDDQRKKKTTSVVTRKKRAVAETLPKNLITRTPEQMSLCRRRFRRPALPTLRARSGLGQGNSGATQRKNDGASCAVSRTRS